MRGVPWRTEWFVYGGTDRRREANRTLGGLRWHVINERKTDRGQMGYLFYRRWFFYGVPTLTGLLCRLFGHRPVVDGYDSTYGAGSARWVQCGRCLRRPQWQGKLPLDLKLGARYRGPWNPDDTSQTLHDAARALSGPGIGGWVKPQIPDLPNGPWGGHGHEEAGKTAELDICLRRKRGWTRYDLALRTRDSGGWTVWLTLGPLFLALKVPWFARLSEYLTRGSWEKREFQIGIDGWTLRLTVWGFDGHSASAWPWWKRGVHVNLKDKLLGRAVHNSSEVEQAEVIVPMPEGSYAATAVLELSTWKRKRSPFTRSSYYCKITPRHFIPVPGKGENSYDCDDDGIWSQSSGCGGPDSEWRAKAVAGLVESALRSRERYAGPNWTPDAGWPPPEKRLAPVSV